MNRRYVYLFSALLFSSLSFAQKKELREAEKAVKKGDVAEAQAAFKTVEAVLDQATNDQKATYYALKGNLAIAQIKNDQNIDANIAELLASIAKVKEYDANPSSKLNQQAAIELGEASTKIFSIAIADNESKNYKGAAKRFKQAYDLQPDDAVNLYYAASMAITAQDYDTAAQYYQALVDMNYDGSNSYYTAIEKTSGELQNFGKDSKMRDLFVKQGTHIEPNLVVEESKRPEIIKNLALVYYQQGKLDKAEQAIVEARQSNPDDLNLLLTHMDLYLKSNNMGKYEELAKEALRKNPNDDVLLYNLGVTSGQAGNTEDAMKYYQQAIAVNPKNELAYLNLAFTKLSPDEELSNKINALGMSAADNKKYEQYMAEKKAIYRNAMNDLEKVLAINPNNEAAVQTLKNIYRALEMNDKLNALNAN